MLVGVKDRQALRKAQTIIDEQRAHYPLDSILPVDIYCYRFVNTEDLYFDERGILQIVEGESINKT